MQPQNLHSPLPQTTSSFCLDLPWLVASQPGRPQPPLLNRSPTPLLITGEERSVIVAPSLHGSSETIHILGVNSGIPTMCSPRKERRLVQYPALCFFFVPWFFPGFQPQTALVEWYLSAGYLIRRAHRDMDCTGCPLRRLGTEAGAKMGGSEAGGPSPRTAASRSMSRWPVDHTEFPHPGSCSYPPGWPSALRIVSLPLQSAAPGTPRPKRSPFTPPRPWNP